MSVEPVQYSSERPPGYDRRTNHSVAYLQAYGLGSPDRAAARNTSALLAKMVEGQIIPRLMMAHQPLPLSSSESHLEDRLGSGVTDQFALMVLSSEVDELLVHFQHFLDTLLTTECLYFEFMTATARRLGDYWAEDIISQAEVSIGLGRLQQLVRMLGRSASGSHGEGAPQRSAFFASCPGEQHSFGLALVDDLFDRAGWKTSIEPSASGDQIADTVGHEPFDLFCLNSSCSFRHGAQFDVVASTIEKVRRVTRNRDMTIIVVGRMFHERPELAVSVGADAAISGESVALLTI